MTPPWRASLCTPIPEIFSAASCLVEAVAAHNTGDHAKAVRLLLEADNPTIWAYTDRGWGKGAAASYGFIEVLGEPPIQPLASQPKPRMPDAKTRVEVLTRDGYHCRFCGIPVIAASTRKRMRVAYPDAVGWGRINATQHAAFQCMWLQFDHLLPNSRGGESTIENIVVTCAVCNFGRMQTTLAEAGLYNPLDRELPVIWSGNPSWNGLGSFVATSSSRPH